MEERITVAGYDVLPHCAAIVCKHVMEKSDVLLFSHDDDGTMQFLCGCEPKVENARVVGVGHVLEWHPDLNNLPTIHPGFEAERASVKMPWIISKTAEDLDASTSIH